VSQIFRKSIAVEIGTRNLFRFYLYNSTAMRTEVRTPEKCEMHPHRTEWVTGCHRKHESVDSCVASSRAYVFSAVPKLGSAGFSRTCGTVSWTSSRQSVGPTHASAPGRRGRIGNPRYNRLKVWATLNTSSRSRQALHFNAYLLGRVRHFPCPVAISDLARLGCSPRQSALSPCQAGNVVGPAPAPEGRPNRLGHLGTRCGGRACFSDRAMRAARLLRYECRAPGLSISWAAHHRARSKRASA
jgi:hypothetical protein